MEFDHDIHAIADGLANLLEGLDRFLHLGGRDVETTVLLRRRIERPDLHRVNAAFEQTLRQYVGSIHERVEVLERSFALANVPVGYRTNISRTDVAIARARVVDADLVATQATQHLVHRLLAHLSEDVPQSDVDRRGRAIFRAGGRLRHRKTDHFLAQRFDVQGIPADQSSGQRVVDMRLDRAGAIECFAEANGSAIGMNADPDHD